MKLFEEYRLYESMWDEPEAELKAADFIKNGYKAGTTSFDIYVEDSDKTAAGTYPGMEALDKILEFLNGLSQEEKDAVGLGWYWDVEVPGDAMGDTIVFVAAPSEVEDFTSRSGSNLEAAEMPIRDALGISHAEPNNLKESGVKRLVHKDKKLAKTSDTTESTAETLNEDTVGQDYRVVLADYDTDDFDINVEFGMQDPEDNEVVDYEYLLKPGQTKGDLVVWLSRDCGFTAIYVHDERPATEADVKRLASDTFPVTGTGDEWEDYGTLDESLTEDVVDHSNSPGVSIPRETIIHDLLQQAAVRKGRRVGTGEEELYNWLTKEDYYIAEFSAWRQDTAYSFKDFPQHLRDSSTSKFGAYDDIASFVGTLSEVTEVLNDVVAKGYEFDFITVSRLLITPPHPRKEYGNYSAIGIDENTDDVFLLSEFDSWEDDQKEYQAPTIRYNKVFNDNEPFIKAIKNAKGYGIIAEAAGSRSKKISITEKQAAKYEILYSDRHTEIVDEDTMSQLVDELEAFTREDVSQIHRIYSNGKLGKTIWTEEEGLL